MQSIWQVIYIRQQYSRGPKTVPLENPELTGEALDASWHTNFSIKAIVSLPGIALTPRAKKLLRTSSSTGCMEIFEPDAFPFPGKLPVLPAPQET